MELDHAGWLWCGSDRGLFRVKLADLNAVADGKLAVVPAFVYGRSVGLEDFQFCDDSFPAAIAARSGQFWFASVKGAVVFDPAALTLNPEPPSVFIEAILRNSELLKDGTASALPAGVRRLEFQFVAPDLTDSDRVRYRFRLDGIGEDWSAANSARSAIYTNLPPGRYRFRVMACNADGVWNEQDANLAFSVAPFFWQTGWFPPLAVAVLAGLLILGSRWVELQRMQRRLRLLEQESMLERERTRIAQDLHDELGANLTSIGWFADRGRKYLMDPAEAGAEFEKIAATARESVQAMDGIVWALNQQNESLENFADYLSHFATEFFRPTPINCQLEIPLNFPDVKMSTAARHHLFLAVKEALNNVVRHSGADGVWIRVEYDDQRLTISVEDNGRGIGSHSGKPGEDGLANIRRRVASLQGTVSVESGPLQREEPSRPSGGVAARPGSPVSGGGTWVRFTVPFAGLK
jgi:YD repeat-containing protein